MPTTGISLIREHTEVIKPPRALWVPFQLGRPLGAPNEPMFQKRVLTAALGLLEAPEGPCLEDFPEEEPESDEITVLACPVILATTATDEKGADKTLIALRREINALRPWYDMSVGKRQRTTVGVSRLDTAALGDFIYGFVSGNTPSNPRDDIPLAQTLKFAIDDLKAYYFEAVTVQPGQSGASSRVLEHWFWEGTIAGRVLLDLKKVCQASPDHTLAEMGSHAIAPHSRTGA